MIGIVIAILALFAVVAWVIAAIAAVQVIGMSPKGQKFRNYGRLGWWRFAELEAQLGAGVSTYLRTYQRAFIAFIVCILAATAVSGLLALAT